MPPSPADVAQAASHQWLGMRNSHTPIASHGPLAQRPAARALSAQVPDDDAASTSQPDINVQADGFRHEAMRHAAMSAAVAASAAVVHAAAALDVTLDDYAHIVDGARSERASSRSIHHLDAGPELVDHAEGADVATHVGAPAAPALAQAATVGKPIARGAFASVHIELIWEGPVGKSPSLASVVKTYPAQVAAAGSGRQAMHERHIANEIALCGKLIHPHIIAPRQVPAPPMVAPPHSPGLARQALLLRIPSLTSAKHFLRFLLCIPYYVLLCSSS